MEGKTYFIKIWLTWAKEPIEEALDIYQLDNLLQQLRDYSFIRIWRRYRNKMHIMWIVLKDNDIIFDLQEHMLWKKSIDDLVVKYF